MNINKMTRKEFESLPLKDRWDEYIECNSLIILPTRRKHDSGFRCMDFIAVKDNTPICRLSGCSDVIHLDGIGGYGFNWAKKYSSVPSLIPPSGWSIDCLSTSGLLRIWPNSGKMITGASLSSFEIYVLQKKNRRI